MRDCPYVYFFCFNEEYAPEAFPPFARTCVRIEPAKRHVRLLRGLFGGLLRLHASEQLIELVGHGGGELLPLPDAANVWTSDGVRGGGARRRRGGDEIVTLGSVGGEVLVAGV